MGTPPSEAEEFAAVASSWEDFLKNVDPERLQRIEAIRQRGENPWPYGFLNRTPAAVVRAEVDARASVDQRLSEDVQWRVAGRVRAKRVSGGLAFLDVEDLSGRIQVVVERRVLGDAFDEAVASVNEGDLVGAAGFGYKTKRGEPSLGARGLVLLAKALLPPPSARRPLKPEVRYGRPYLALLQSKEAREVLLKRAAITRAVRGVLEGEEYVEVAIPVLEKVYGGASAQPFMTHSRAKDMPMYLRIAHELPLKKLLVGGMERVYHVGPAFRNEDIDTTHNPEFTLMECYSAYSDYHDMMGLAERIFEAAALAAHGRTVIALEDGASIDLRGPYERVTMYDAIERHGKLRVRDMTDAELAAELAARGLEVRGGFTRGLAIAELFGALAEPHLAKPTFVIDHPRETTPLCKAHRSDPALVERFELFIAGREHANAYSELNDPILQAELFREQEARRTGGDAEAHPTDMDFLEALKFGMPPAGGMGIGIDRLVMTVLGIPSIKAVLPFPQIK